MHKDWYPFFSALLWFVTKAIGVVLLVFGLIALGPLFAVGFTFSGLVMTVLLPIALGWVVLTTEFLFDIATAEMRRRLAEK
ncbi:MAG: hypothetical protein JNL12_03275 [Planctomycetes bacterium]|nr:hypothetical protein [Planctomycetota bacterium]